MERLKRHPEALGAALLGGALAIGVALAILLARAAQWLTELSTAVLNIIEKGITHG